MNTTLLSPSRARVALLAGLLTAAATAALAQHATFLQRLQQWERETGKTSRMTHYAGLEAHPLPPPSAAATALIDRYLDEPDATDPSGFAELAQAYVPAFDVLTSAWNVSGTEMFPYGHPEDPVPNFLVYQTTAKLLCCRARAYARQGQIDAALSDVASVWLMGHTFDAANASLITSLIGFAVRGLSMKHLSEIVRRRDLTEAQLEKLRAVFASHRPSRTGVAPVVEFELRFMGSFMALEFPQQAGCIASSVERLVALTRDASAASPDRRSEALQAYAVGAEDVPKQCPALAKTIPDFRESFNRQLVTDARENVMITAIVVLSANAQVRGTATEAQVAEMAGPLGVYMVDPFTGRPPMIVNRGGGEVAVVSTGPDLRAEPSGWTAYDHKTSWAGGGDIFFSRLK